MTTQRLSINSLGCFQFPVLETLLFKEKLDRSPINWKANELSMKAACDWETCLVPINDFNRALFELHCLGFADKDGEVFTPTAEAKAAWERERCGQ